MGNDPCCPPPPLLPMSGSDWAHTGDRGPVCIQWVPAQQVNDFIASSGPRASQGQVKKRAVAREPLSSLFSLIPRTRIQHLPLLHALLPLSPLSVVSFASTHPSLPPSCSPCLRSLSIAIPLLSRWTSSMEAEPWAPTPFPAPCRTFCGDWRKVREEGSGSKPQSWSPRATAFGPVPVQGKGFRAA